jgi:hypothetical protein
VDGTGERSITRRVRVAPRRPSPARAATTHDNRVRQPDGMMWPPGGFEADQYGPAGEVVVFADLFRGLQRRWRRSRLARAGRAR